MDKTQKKCLVGSTLVHCALAVLLVIGPAWVPKPNKVDDLPILDFIPDRLIDEAFSGGGTPDAAPPPPAEATQPAPPPSEPQPAAPPPPVRAEPPPPKPEPKPEPEPAKPVVKEPTELPKPKKEKPEKPAPADPPKEKPAPERPSVKVNLKPVKRYPADSAKLQAQAKAASEAAAARKAAQDRQNRIAGSLSALSNNLSKGTVVGIPGAGGEAYANYGQVVRSIYYNAWMAPADVEDENASVETRVVVNRDGNIVRDSTYVARRSGISAVDKSVQQALDRVQRLPPFPDGAKDDRRTFIIHFDLKAKRLRG